MGRRTYGGDDPNAGTDSEGAFGGKWHGAVVVLTHDPPAQPVDGVMFATDLTTAVAAAKEAAGGRYVNVLGADVARQCLEAGLLDEVLVIVAPVLLGDGTRLFDHPGGTNVALEPLRPDDTGPLRLWFRVARRAIVVEVSGPPGRPRNCTLRTHRVSKVRSLSAPRTGRPAKRRGSVRPCPRRTPPCAMIGPQSLLDLAAC